MSLLPVLVATKDPDHVRAHAATDQRAVAATAPASPAHLATSPRVAVTAPHTVFVVGDSLTVGTQPWLASAMHQRGWRLTGVDARVGRPVAEGLNILRKDRLHLPPTVVIALGTNDLGATASAVATWMSTARRIVGTRRIVWVNLCLDDTREPRLHDFRALNAALARAAPRSGIQIADWCTYAHHHGIVPGGDGIHYAPNDYRRRAWFYALSLASVTSARSPLPQR